MSYAKILKKYVTAKFTLKCPLLTGDVARVRLSFSSSSSLSCSAEITSSSMVSENSVNVSTSCVVVSPMHGAVVS